MSNFTFQNILLEENISLQVYNLRYRYHVYIQNNFSEKRCFRMQHGIKYVSGN